MVYMVIFVLAQPEHLDAVVAAWHDAGSSDTTVLQSKNLVQIADRCRRDDLPLFPSLGDIFENDEFDHYTVFTVVEGEAQIDRLIAVTEQLIGNLDAPDNGVLFALPVARVKGLRQNTGG